MKNQLQRVKEYFKSKGQEGKRNLGFRNILKKAKAKAVRKALRG